MFRSFKTKILFLTVTILLLSSVPFMISTMKGFEEAMYEAGEESARNILRLVMLNIENEYKSLIFHKEFTLEMRKRQMKNVATLVYDNFDKFYELFKEGQLSQREAQLKALELARSLRYFNNDYFFIYNRELTAISHPDATVMGKNFADYQDPNGNYVLRDLIKASLQEGGGYTKYWWKRLDTVEPVPKIGYALYYPKWDWMIGTGVYVDDIEEEARKKLKAILEGLSDNFSKIRIARTGYLFLFDGKKQMLIHPELSGKNVSMIENPQTGNPLVDDWMAATNNQGKPFEYLWDKPGARGDFSFPKESYVAHFKPLDWYLVSSVYKDELKMPAKRLIKKQIYIIIVIFLISVAAAYILVKRVAKPLNKLTEYAKELVAHNFTATDETKSEVERLPERHKDEVGKLAESFVYMERTLRQYLIDLKETTAANERLGRLRRFFSPQLAEMIVEGGTADPLKTHRRDVTVVFLDLRGFTAFAEKVEPEEVMRVLREYHAEMGKLILEHEGTLERFTGDGMMIFFNDPMPIPNPAERAIRMAVAMREGVRKLSAAWRKWDYDLGFGIGVAQGYATIGAIGFEGRWDYGAIGTVTNLAARLCGEAKAGQILVTRRLAVTMEELVEGEFVGDLVLKGFQKPVSAFNVVRLKEN